MGIRLLRVATMTICVALVAVSAVTAGPSVKWSQASIEKVLIPGQTRTLNVTFQVATELHNIEVFTVPELTSFVTVTPTSFDTLRPDLSYTISLFINVPPTVAVGTQVDGTVHLRLDKNTLPDVLKLSLEVE